MTQETIIIITKIKSVAVLHTFFTGRPAKKEYPMPEGQRFRRQRKFKR